QEVIIMMTLLIIIYIGAALSLAIYALNSWVLTALYLKHRGDSPPRVETGAAINEDNLPAVTVQLPVFNETFVVERLIDAVVKLDYPADRLQIQVLDDSTDASIDIALARVNHYQKQGVDITLIHRRDRTGFKAGALKNGLNSAKGEFVAIFDADFIPNADFLKETVPYLVADPNLGFVQTRWGHVNRDYSRLTAAQSIALDGHFVIEQTARNRAGLFINFNGTEGVWRQACIEDAGGWQGDTISEDFDLSYRAELKGWQCLYLPHVVAPAEIPPQLAAFKRQQFRWAKGSIQCLKKLGWRILWSRLSLGVKLEALIHLSSYLLHPFMTILAITTPIFVMTGASETIRFPLMYLSLLSLGPPVLFAVAQASLYPTGWLRRYKAMGLLVFLGSGIALSNTKAVIEALLGTGNVFRRTPKFNVTSTADQWEDNVYRLPLDWMVVGELALSAYSLLGAWMAASRGYQFAVPFILLYAVGFGYVGLQGIWDERFSWKGWLDGFIRQPSSHTKTADQRKPVSVSVEQ
ncbi:MAG: cellulose synthase family protein, partial [Chloroflexota bacterium]